MANRTFVVLVEGGNLRPIEYERGSAREKDGRAVGTLEPQTGGWIASVAFGKATVQYTVDSSSVSGEPAENMWHIATGGRSQNADVLS